MDMREQVNRILIDARSGVIDDEARELLGVYMARLYPAATVRHPWVGEVLNSIEWGGVKRLGGMLFKFHGDRWAAAKTTGYCCATVWFESVDVDPGALGGVVTAVQVMEWHEMEDEPGDVEEMMRWRITTDRGEVNIETRLSHNGYYGGDVMWTEVTSGDEARFIERCLRGGVIRWARCTDSASRGVLPEGYE